MRVYREELEGKKSSRKLEGTRGRRRELEGQEGISMGREAEVRKKGKKEAGKRESLHDGILREKKVRSREREG